MKNINSKEELEEISATGKTYVQFSASWCGPCRMLHLLLKNSNKN